MKLETAQFELSAGLSSQLPASTLPEVVFSGRSNVGKSTLINTLLRRKSLARTSATPGKTATINFYKLDTVRLVDLPGYGYAKISDSERRRWGQLIEGYFADESRDLRLVVQLLDIRHTPSADDRQMIDFLTERELPFLVVLTKADKLNKTERARQTALFEDLFADYEGLFLLPFSATTGEGREPLLDILTEVTED
ncbi:MAG: YihA family ribosome biogenesis GTP-binding protein [Clostridia bacterium]|nr:YihA family ribosome biogenesis GTP-binding protein [Clostridia bacterium]